MHKTRLVPYLFLSVIFTSAYVYYVSPELVDPRFKWAAYFPEQNDRGVSRPEQLFIEKENELVRLENQLAYSYTDSLFDIFQYQLDSIKRLDSMFHQMSFQSKSKMILTSSRFHDDESVGRLDLQYWKQARFMDESLQDEPIYSKKNNRTNSRTLDSIWNLYLGQFGIKKKIENKLDKISLVSSQLEPLKIGNTIIRNENKVGPQVSNQVKIQAQIKENREAFRRNTHLKSSFKDQVVTRQYLEDEINSEKKILTSSQLEDDTGSSEINSKELSLEGGDTKEFTRKGIDLSQKTVHLIGNNIASLPSLNVKRSSYEYLGNNGLGLEKEQPTDSMSNNSFSYPTKKSNKASGDHKSSHVQKGEASSMLLNISDEIKGLNLAIRPLKPISVKLNVSNIDKILQAVNRL